MNDITEKTIARLRSISSSPELPNPNAFASEVLRRINQDDKRMQWLSFARYITYAASICIIVLFVGLKWKDCSLDNNGFEKAFITGNIKNKEDNQIIETISRTMELVEQYKYIKI